MDMGVGQALVGISVILVCLLTLYIWGGMEPSSEPYKPKPKGNPVVWRPCDAKGCKKETGLPKQNCLKCLGRGYLELDDELPLLPPVRVKGCTCFKGQANRCGACLALPKPKKESPNGPPTTYLHCWLVFQGGYSGTEKALKGRLWICSRCQEVSDSLIATPTGCLVPPGEDDSDPTSLVAAHNEGKIEDTTPYGEAS